MAGICVRSSLTKRGRSDHGGPGGLAVLAMMVCAIAGPAVAQEAPGVSAVMREGRLTLSARGAPLGEILAELGRLTGVLISVRVDATAPTTIAFDGVAPEQGLRRLLRAKNAVFIYSARGLSEIRIYASRGDV